MASTLPDSDIIVQYSCFQTCSNLFKQVETSSKSPMIFSWFFSFQEIEKNSWNQNRAKDVIQMSYVQELTERNEEDSFGRGRKTRVTTVIFFYRGRFDEFSAIQGMHHTLAVTRCIYRGRARVWSGPIRGTGGTLCTPRLKPKQEIEIPMFYNYLSQLQNPAEQPCMLAPLVRSGVTYRIYR